MFDIIRLQLHGQFTEKRLWGLALLAISLVVAVPVAWYLYTFWGGYVGYAAATVGFLASLLGAARLFGPLLSRVRKRWTA